MAFNFDSAQFNRESTPKRLGNWEVPRWSPTKARPLEYRPDPKPICDLNGHFLPGAPRGTSRCFGHFTGTWDLPRKITRKVAEELQKEPPNGRFPDWFNLRVQRKVVPPARMRKKAKAAVPMGQTSPKQKDEHKFLDCEVSEKTINEKQKDNNEQYKLTEEGPSQTNVEQDPLGLNEVIQPKDDDGNGPYVPGSLTEPEKRHESYDLLVKDAVEQLHGPQENADDKFWRKVAENALKDERARDENMKLKKSDTPKLPAVNVSHHFQFARKMHDTNLEHQPLPDTLGYRNLKKIGEHRDSDIIVKPYAIGWKGYGASGPTCCTKMRVHRPKTCDTRNSENKAQNHRPSTSAPDLGKKSSKPMSLMDLAICWDFRPENPKQEPKPPKHIDGSNGSRAPAVFTMVHTPKDDFDDQIKTHLNPIFTQNRSDNNIIGHHSVPYFEKDMTKDKRKDSCDVQYCTKHNGGEKQSNSSSRKSSGSLLKPACDGIHGCGTLSESSRKSSRDDKRPDKLHPVKEVWNNNNNKKVYDGNSLVSYEKTPLAQGKLHQSSPNERTSNSSNKDSSGQHSKYKHCLSCNGTKLPEAENKKKEDYKFAFKAGNPDSVKSSNSRDSKEVKVPKMRHPYSKKSYTIPTLAPPFSVWRDANATGYPEHWRLASVYQHAYKPPEQRRKSLIASVFQ